MQNKEMKEVLISQETSNLALSFGWTKDKCDCHRENCQFDKIKTTQSLLQKWLREEYKIDIVIHTSNTPKGNRYRVDVSISHYVIKGVKSYTESNFKSYEEALEDGLKYSLKNMMIYE